VHICERYLGVQAEVSLLFALFSRFRFVQIRAAIMAIDLLTATRLVAPSMAKTAICQVSYKVTTLITSMSW